MALAPTAIATPSLILEPVSVETARAVVAGDLSEITAGAGWPHADTVDGLRIALVGGHAPGWFVTLDGVVIGDCGTHGDPDPQGDVELGFGLAAPYRGRGFGSEVARGLSRWLLAQPGVTRVIGRAQLSNTPSRRALERAGFRLESAGPLYALYALASR
jgi:RimJ/RimL family protein N-acetyltransferase